MTEPDADPDNLKDEFHLLGKNLIATLSAAWNSPERKKLQQEIEASLIEFSRTINAEARNFQDSSSGQKLREDLDELKQKAESGEMETRIRKELLDALKIANTELRKVASRWSPEASSQESQNPYDSSRGSDSSVRE